MIKYEGSSSSVLLCRFHRTASVLSLHLCLLCRSVLALAREFLCLLFMTGNAHHKRLVSTHNSTGSWTCVMKKDTITIPHGLSNLYSKQKSTPEPHRDDGSRGTRLGQRPLAPAHAAVQASVSWWPVEGRSAEGSGQRTARSVGLALSGTPLGKLLFISVCFLSVLKTCRQL